MNSKLASLMIRSNALVIEALSELSHQSNPTTFDEARFWNLRNETIELAETAEELENSVVTNVAMQITEAQSSIVSLQTSIPDIVKSEVAQALSTTQPMVAMSPSQNPLHPANVSPGRMFTAQRDGSTYKAQVVRPTSSGYIVMVIESDDPSLPYGSEFQLTDEELTGQFLSWV